MRLCNIEGDWSEPYVLHCTSIEFVNLENRVKFQVLLMIELLSYIFLISPLFFL